MLLLFEPLVRQKWAVFYERTVRDFILVCGRKTPLSFSLLKNSLIVLSSIVVGIHYKGFCPFVPTICNDNGQIPDAAAVAVV